MPLQARISQKTFSFPTLDLPYQSRDFDFETANQFKDRGLSQTLHEVQASKGASKDKDLPGLQRRDSGETFVTETVVQKEGGNQNDDKDSQGDLMDADG